MNGTAGQSLNLHKTQSAHLDHLSTCFGYMIRIASFILRWTALSSGETSPREWRRALGRLQKRHPILSICIVGEPGSVPSFRQTDATPIPLRIVEDEDEPELGLGSRSWKGIGNAFQPKSRTADSGRFDSGRPRRRLHSGCSPLDRGWPFARLCNTGHA